VWGFGEEQREERTKHGKMIRGGRGLNLGRWKSVLKRRSCLNFFTVVRLIRSFGVSGSRKTRVPEGGGKVEGEEEWGDEQEKKGP